MRNLVLGFTSSLAFALHLVACSSPEPGVRVGKEYSESAKAVVDTASVFHVNDPVFVQVFPQGKFGATEIDMLVYKGDQADSTRLVYARTIAFDSSKDYLLVRGTQKNPLTTRILLRSGTPGVYFLEFRQGQRVLASKRMESYLKKK